MKIYQLYCDHCHWKKITDGHDISGLYEMKTSPLQKTLPKLDEKGKTIPSEFRQQRRKFRCPQCGHYANAKPIRDYQGELNERLEAEQREERIERLKNEEIKPDGHQGST